MEREHLGFLIAGDKWCVVSDEEAQKCSTMASAFGAHSLTPRYVFVYLIPPYIFFRSPANLYALRMKPGTFCKVFKRLDNII